MLRGGRGQIKGRIVLEMLRGGRELIKGRSFRDAQRGEGADKRS